MIGRDNFVEMDRSVDSINVGRRHRRDLGDIDLLVDSIRTVGLLQPITVTPQGILVCGARRLAAVRTLGWRTVNVWVLSGVSTPLHQLLAEQHENTMRKDLSPIEAAGLYAELKSVLAQDAARRQASTRFGTPADGHGPAESAAPRTHSRVDAARMVTGTSSYTRLESILELQRLSGADTAGLAAAAAEALQVIERTGKVNGPYTRVRQLAAQTESERPHGAAASSSTTTPARDRTGRLLLSLAAQLDATDAKTIARRLTAIQWQTIPTIRDAMQQLLDHHADQPRETDRT